MAKVYVGTWAKYNNSSLAGAWIDLAECGTYENFLAKCREVHKNEPDPEYKILDTEDFPNGLSCMEWISEQDFNDVLQAIKDEQNDEQDTETSESPLSNFQIIDYSEKAIALTGDTKQIKDELKVLGGRFNPRLSCGAGWIFPKKKESQLRELLADGTVSESKNNQPKTDSGVKFKKWLNEYAKTHSADEYYVKNSVGAVKINGYFYFLRKPNIENKFCFSDEGSAYDTYCSLKDDKGKLEQYFLNQNLSQFDDKQCGDEKLDWYVKYMNDRCYLTKMDEWTRSAYCYNDYELLTDQNAIKDLEEGIKWSRDMFEKRLRAYLKRYGTSKIHTWTYWANA